MTFRRYWIATLIASCGFLGCASNQQQAEAPKREVPLTQSNDLALVRLRAQDLRQGMGKADVYNLLGAPAEYVDGTWVYRGQGESLVVKFDGDRYTGHSSGESAGKGRRG